MDKDLHFLTTCSNEELDFLVQLLVDKGSLNQQLTTKTIYQQYYPDHRHYIELICDELIDFGSTTLLKKRDYLEIVRCVAQKLHLETDLDLAQLEQRILDKIFDHELENLTTNDIKAIIQNLKPDHNLNQVFNFALLQSQTLRQILATIPSIAAKLGPRTMPLLMLFNLGLYAAIRMLGPAYRVIIPAVSYIALLRRYHSLFPLK